MTLSKILYRDLLYAAKQFDRRADLRALLSTNLLQRPVIHETNTRLPHIERLNRAVLEYLDHRSFYVPSSTRKPLVQVVREQFRAAVAAESSSTDRSSTDRSSTDRSSTSAATPVDKRVLVDTAFAALKALNDKLAEAQELGVTDPPAKRVRYRDGAKVATPAPETIPNVQHAEDVASGVFLLSHPLLSGLFSRAVIVLTEHSTRGARGFIVNQPTTSSLMKAFKVHPSIMRAFGASKVRTGGPVRTEHAEVLHAKPEFGGQRIRTSNFERAAVVIDTDTTDDIETSLSDSTSAMNTPATPTPTPTALFVGVDLETAAKAVEDNVAQASELMFLNGVSTWTAGQLENEMKRGTWVAVKAPLALAVNPSKDLWRDLMHTLDGEYRDFSAMPVIVDDDDEYVDDESGDNE